MRRCKTDRCVWTRLNQRKLTSGGRYGELLLAFGYRAERFFALLLPFGVFFLLQLRARRWRPGHLRGSLGPKERVHPGTNPQIITTCDRKPPASDYAIQPAASDRYKHKERDRSILNNSSRQGSTPSTQQQHNFRSKFAKCVMQTFLRSTKRNIFYNFCSSVLYNVTVSLGTLS